MEIETATWSEFPNGWKAIVEQILVSEEINKSKKAKLGESQSGIRVGKLTIWVRSFEIKQESFWWALKSPKTKTLADGLAKKTLSIADEIESKAMYKHEEGGH